MGVGDRIRKILETKDLSQKEFAEILNIAPTTLSGYITNKREPDIGTLRNIALKLGVSLDFLLEVKTEEDPMVLGNEEWELVVLYRTLSEEQQEFILEQTKLMSKHNVRDRSGVTNH
ncbi:MAG: helix-turn-helix transcriptional regulator [Clostridiales bacterium]|jgi:transcriptional regulator with XRE-family HTH domain|nr:helix-turn-helix transcriptional regulator [Clostridiales bacterium]